MNNFQSIWHPISDIAINMKFITVFLVVMSTIVLIITATLLFFALKKRSRADKESFDPNNKFILWSGLIIPTLILILTLIISLESTLSISRLNKAEHEVIIRVTGHQYWWEVEYPDYNVITANEIYLPVKTNVKFELLSKDVIHSFWIPNIHGKRDMLPDHKTFLSVNINKTGRYRGQCTEFCGPQHALMAFPVVAVSPDEFNKWIEQNKTSGIQKIKSQRGKEIFYRESCHACHAIQGTQFLGKSGPDLTHIASRLTLGAGTISNSRENLAKWILNSQKIKPMNRMPSYETLPQEDLGYLLDYLEELK